MSFAPSTVTFGFHKKYIPKINGTNTSAAIENQNNALPYIAVYTGRLKSVNQNLPVFFAKNTVPIIDKIKNKKSPPTLNTI